MRKILFFLPAMICFFAAGAQVSGVKNIPTDYASLSAAFTALNSAGVGAGGVTLTITAGYTETAPAGGLQLGSSTLNASTSASQQIRITGNSNVITAPVGTTTNLDGILSIKGTDYVTISGLVLQESAGNTTATTAMEWAIGLFNLNAAAPFDGCQYDTIRNCTISMNRTIATPSKGIFMAHQVYNSTTTLSVTAATDLHSYNGFYGNTISNIITAIYLGGATSASDVGNDVGGSSAATGNTISNVIGALYSSVGAITCTYQTNANISYNSINNTANGGTNAIATAWGIYAYGPSSTYTVNKNTVTLKESSISTAYAIYGIYGNASGANITAQYNVVDVSEVSGSAVNNIGIFLPNGNNTNISNNTIRQSMAVSGTTYGSYTTSTGNLVVSGNTYTQKATVATSSQFYSLVNGGTAASETVQNNIFQDCVDSVTGTTGFMALIYTANTTANKNISNNQISGVASHNSTADFYGIICNPASATGAGTFTVANNNFSGIVKKNNGGAYVFYLAPAAASSQTLNLYQNTISNLAASGNSVVAGVYCGNLANANIYNNSISNLSTATTVNGIYLASGGSTSIYANQLYSLSSTGIASGGVNGILCAGGTSTNVHNNFIHSLTAPAQTGVSDIIRGISVLNAGAGTSINLYYNSIYLIASSTGANFSTSGIYHSANATATVGALDMRNNIVVNVSAPSGTGNTAAFRRSATTLANFLTSSNNNDLYAGVPSATNLIYSDGTNNDQTLPAYQSRVATAETESVSVMPNFISATDLHLAATGNCNLDGSAVPIAGFTNDYDAQARDANAPDMGADEFTASYGTTLAGVAGSATCRNKNISASGTVFTTGSCGIIARVVPNGASPVSGKVNTCVTLDATQQYFNGEPYLQRHYDIEPATNAAAATAAVTLYFTDAEFTDYNTNNPAWPKLPTVATGGNSDTRRSNVYITQFHGSPTTSPSTPGNYNGAGFSFIQPGAANVYWNGNYWEVSFNATGFSGFYLHTSTFSAPLAVSLHYFNGQRQGGQHLLSWKLNCPASSGMQVMLERSGGASGGFSAVPGFSNSPVRCNEPMSFTDKQPLDGMNYYRLRITDAEGKLSYSHVLALLHAATGAELVTLAPNPVSSNGSVRLQIAAASAGQMDLQIHDMQGRLLRRQTAGFAAGYNPVTLSLQGLAPGSYFISGSVDGKPGRTLRFVIQ